MWSKKHVPIAPGGGDNENTDEINSTHYNPLDLQDKLDKCNSELDKCKKKDRNESTAAAIKASPPLPPTSKEEGFKLFSPPVKYPSTGGTKHHRRTKRHRRTKHHKHTTHRRHTKRHRRTKHRRRTKHSRRRRG